MLPEVLLLPPHIKSSGDDAVSFTINSKMPDYTFYDQVWVCSALEAFKCVISKEDYAVISNLQRLERITALEKPKPIRLYLRNQIMTSEDEGFTNSDDSDFENPPAPTGDKVTKQFLPHCVFSKS